MNRCPHCGNDDLTLISDTGNGFWFCEVCAKLWSKFLGARGRMKL